MGQEDELNTVMVEILEGDTPHAYSVIAAITSWLQRYHLYPRLEPYEILHEAYTRTLTRIRRGTIVEVRDFKAWLKKTAFNIIREENRKQQRESVIDPQSDFLDNRALSDQPYVSSELLDTKLALFQTALEIFRQQEPEIYQWMGWRLVEKLSWEQIRKHLLQRDAEVQNVAALRQKACRGKRKLRKIYHNLEKEHEDFNNRVPLPPNPGNRPLR